MLQPASHCPFGTAKMLALIVSLEYAPIFKLKAIIELINGFKVIPIFGSP